MSKDPSIPRRNKINWHYVRDDSIFSTIKVVSRHQNTQQYDAMLHIELTNNEIRNTKAYKEYYACATGEAAPKPKASARRKRSGSDTSITPPTATTTLTTTVVVTSRLTAAAKGKQPAKAKSSSDPSELGGSGTDEGTGSKPGVPYVPTNESEELSWNSSDDKGDDAQEKERDDDDQDQEVVKHDDKVDSEESKEIDEEGKSDEEDDNEETRDEESFDPIPQTPESSEDEEELYKDVNINQGRGIQATLDVEDSHVTLTPVHPDGQQESSSVSSQFVTSMLNPPSDVVILKRRRDDDDDQEEGPFDGLDRGSKRRREGKEPESASAPLETITRSAGRSTTGSKSRQVSASKSTFAEEHVQTISKMDEPSYPSKKPPTPNRDWNKTLPAVQGSTQTWISELAKQDDSRSSFNELLDTSLDFSNFIMNRLRVDTLTPKLLAGPTFELIKGSCTCLIELEYHLEEGGAFSHKYTKSVTKTKAIDYGNIKWIEDLVPRSMWIQEPIDYDKHALWGVSHWGHKRQQLYRFAINRESALDVYSKRRIIAVTDLKIMKWHSYKHLDWITVRRDDDKLYKFKEGDFKRLHLQDIEDMLLLLVQGKLSNMTVEERFAFNVFLRCLHEASSFSDRKDAYTAYSNPRGFIYQNKDKKNRLMRIDELYKFSDGTLNDVRNALDDHLKGIRMQYLPQTI
nr:hypothetical protein [Tanacetum cinerariifolium]